MDGEIGDGLDGTVSRSNQPTRIYHEETNGSHRRNLHVLAEASKRSTAMEMRMSRRVSIRFQREKERQKERSTPLSDVPMSYRNEQKEPQPQRGTLILKYKRASPR